MTGITTPRRWRLNRDGQVEPRTAPRSARSLRRSGGRRSGRRALYAALRLSLSGWTHAYSQTGSRCSWWVRGSAPTTATRAQHCKERTMTDAEIRQTFRREHEGYISQTPGGFIKSPAYLIPLVASDRVPAGRLELPDGYDAETLNRIRWATGAVGQEVKVSPRQAAELAHIGAQILDLMDLDPPLSQMERQSIEHLIAVTDPRPALLEEYRVEVLRIGVGVRPHVRVTHVPTGRVIECDDTESEIQNRKIAIARLETSHD